MSKLGLPCINCICVPMCNQKKWLQLTSDCQLLRQHMGDIEDALSKGESVTVHVLNRVYHLNRSETSLLTLKVENTKTKEFELEGYDLDYGQHDRIYKRI